MKSNSNIVSDICMKDIFVIVANLLVPVRSYVSLYQCFFHCILEILIHFKENEVIIFQSQTKI